MAKFAIIDINNLFYRAARGTQGDAFTKGGMALHIAFNSFRRMFYDMGCDHLVVCAEGRSWRYKAFAEYKAKRRLEKACMNAAEREDEEVLLHALEDLITYLTNSTRATVLRSSNIEGDDFVARFIKLHPNDEHLLLSSDSDFIQLLDDNVTIFDAMMDRVITTKGVHNLAGKEMVFSINNSNGKISIKNTLEEEQILHRREQKRLAAEHKKAEAQKAKEDPAYTPTEFVMTEYSWEAEEDWWKKALFLKLIRGDSTDGIFSAFPGVRYKGSKKKVGIDQCWADRHDKGYEWNNFMNQTWDKIAGSDDEGNPLTETVRVEDRINFNKTLIDLTAQPQEVINEMDAAIVEQLQKEPVRDIGTAFLRFCGKHQLARAAQDASLHGRYLSMGYPLG